MLSCAEAVGRLWEYLDGTLDRADTDLVEEHLARCRRCCGELEFAHELRRLLASGRDLPVPEESRQRLEDVLQHLEEE